jgi:hypothetical protein
VELYRAPYGCSHPCEVPYRVAQPYHLPRMESIHVTLSRSVEDLGCFYDTYLGMCSEAKVCRSVASLSTAITRQTFGFFVANSSTTHTHSCHMRILRACHRLVNSHGMPGVARIRGFNHWAGTDVSHWRSAHAHNRASRHYCEPQIAACVPLGKAIL